LIIYISQGNIATQLRRGGIFSDRFIDIFHGVCRGERILKIGEYLVDIWARCCWPPCM